jgi:hypothetical protein
MEQMIMNLAVMSGSSIAQDRGSPMRDETTAYIIHITFSSFDTCQPRQPTTPMSTAISCTRASVPRVATRAAVCRRYASTETVSVESSSAPMLSKPKKVTEPLGVRMHRKLYPYLYTKDDEVNWRPDENVQRLHSRRAKPKQMAQKWAPVMRQAGVQKHLSTSTRH